MVMHYLYFSVVTGFLIKQWIFFRNFLAVLPSPTLYKVETRERSTLFVGWTKGLGLCEFENVPEMQMS